MMPNEKAVVPGKTGSLPGMMGGAAPKISGGPAEEKPSLSKVKDLLQQAMDMIGLLGAEDEVVEGPPTPGTGPRPRPPMSPRLPVV